MRKFRDIYEERYTIFLENFPKVENIYNTPYNMPELDPLRHEIALCLIFGFHQAALTLTNHLIEWFIKLMLIYKDSIEKSKQKNDPSANIESFEKYFEHGIENYMGSDMGPNINNAKKLGILTKEQWRVLDNIRADFRNAFGHADSSKIFKDSEIEITGISTANETIGIEDPSNRKIAKIPILHGFMKVKFAEAHAMEYFLFVDGLIRETLPKIIPSLKELL